MMPCISISGKTVELQKKNLTKLKNDRTKMGEITKSIFDLL